MPGEGFRTSDCNNKLIGAQFFNAGFLAFSTAQGKLKWATDYVGPRDDDGHGSHTASTAAGNEGVAATVSVLGSPGMGGDAAEPYEVL